MFFGLFRKNPEREARQLHKDARIVVDMARQTYRAQLLIDIARITREGLTQIEELCGDDAAKRAREIDRYQALHREARRQHDQVGLTAYTLVIIHARSLDLSGLGAPARTAIQEFLDEWPADRQQDGTLPG